MTENTQEVVLEDKIAPITPEHDCPYENSKQEFLNRLIGGNGLASYRLHGLERELESIHSDGVCPPTHIDRGPTRVWADWVQGLHR